MRLRLATVLAMLAALALPSLAQASGADVIKDCADGSLSGHYSQRDYSQALAHLPADLDEYTDCRDIIRRAQLSGGTGASGGTGGGGGTGAAAGGVAGAGGTDGTGGGGDGTGGAGAVADPLATATPEERAAVAKALQSGSAPVQLDGRPITPGTLGGSQGTHLSDIPTPLLVVLALLAAAGVAAAGYGARRFVLDRRPA